MRVSHEYFLSLANINTLSYAYLFQKALLRLQQNGRQNIIVQNQHQQGGVSHHDGSVGNLQYDVPPALPPRAATAVLFSPLSPLLVVKPQGR